MDRVKGLLDETADITSCHRELKELYNDISELRLRLDRPLRVAIVGLIKAGKSTLINSILRKRILVTGNLETTYTVSWFRYSDTPGIIMHFKDGHIRNGQLEELGKWTVRDSKKDNSDIDNVEYVEILDNNPILKDIEIIDTPGLDSTYSTDSENTIDFLGISSQMTAREASKADAIVYAFSKGIGESDNDILSAFHNIFTNASPINAFGVLTRVDSYWNDFDKNPFDEANKIIETYKNDTYIKTRLYTVLPVSGKISGGTDEISEDDYSIFKRLSAMEPERLQKLLRNAKRFCENEQDIYGVIPVSPEERNRIFNGFDLYGTYIVIRCIGQGMSRKEIGEFLFDYSGTSGVRKLIIEHFGRRAAIIKVRYIFERIKDRCHKLLGYLGEDSEYLKELVKYILDEYQQLEENEQYFNELRVLQAYYNGELKLQSEEEKELLSLTGELGSSIEDKLRCRGLTIKEMSELALARVNYWYGRANLKMDSKIYKEMANTLGRSCEIMLYHLKNLEL